MAPRIGQVRDHGGAGILEPRLPPGRVAVLLVLDIPVGGAPVRGDLEGALPPAVPRRPQIAGLPRLRPPPAVGLQRHRRRRACSVPEVHQRRVAAPRDDPGALPERRAGTRGRAVGRGRGSLDPQLVAPCDRQRLLRAAGARAGLPQRGGEQQIVGGGQRHRQLHREAGRRASGGRAGLTGRRKRGKRGTRGKRDNGSTRQSHREHAVIGRRGS